MKVFKSIKAARALATRVTLITAVSLMSSPAFAGGSGMPWEGPLEQIADSITGPVARIAGIIAIVLAALGFAMSEGGGVMRKIIGIVFGLCVAFSAATFFLPLFGFAGGAAF